MPIVVKANKNQSANDLIKQFKRATASFDVVQKAKDKRFFISDAQERASRKIDSRRLQRRIRKLKKMKNISDSLIARLRERI